VAGQAQDGFVLAPYSGLSQYGDPMVALYLENSVAIGSGGQSFMDGHDSYGTTVMAGCGMQDVESHEASDPVLFLWRSIPPNTAGAGTYRGGQGMEQAYLVAYTDELRADTTASVARVPPGGFGGGLPGSGCGLDLARGSAAMALVDGGEMPGPDFFDGGWEALPSKITGLNFEKGTVIRTYSGGGGGLGDPLMRDPELVAKDIQDGYVSVDHGERVYGVVVAPDSLELDREATESKRAEVRVERLGSAPERSADPPKVPGTAVARTDGQWTCGYCETGLSGVGENWRASSASTERPIADLYRDWEMTVKERAIDPKVVVRQYFCPSCAGLLGADVAVKDHATKAAPAIAS
jgi:N-methylhydantoinase B